jgi:hypothetical protein
MRRLGLMSFATRLVGRRGIVGLFRYMMGQGHTKQEAMNTCKTYIHIKYQSDNEDCVMLF